MKNIFLILAFVANIVGCHITNLFAEGNDFKSIHVQELQSLIDNSKIIPVYIFDANGAKARDEKGVIPGAKLLNSPSSYDTSILPVDRNATLVFYCYNTHCTASHTAAKRAIENGYKNVSVMVDGIVGWLEAGKKAEHNKA